MSSSESSEDAERWQAVFAAVTDSELRFYESAPWSGESWKTPVEAYALIATRLVGSAKRQDTAEFSIRCATVEGVVTHNLRAETHRDLAVWAKTLVNGSHASAVTQREFVCSKYFSVLMTVICTSSWRIIILSISQRISNRGFLILN